MAYHFFELAQAAAAPYKAKSWWPDYVRAQAGGADALISWERTAGRYADFDFATDGDFIGRSVAMAQDHRTNLFGINVDQSTANKISGTALIVGATFLGGAAGGALAGAGAGSSLGGALANAGVKDFLSEDKKKARRRHLSRPALEHLHPAEIF